MIYVYIILFKYHIIQIHHPNNFNFLILLECINGSTHRIELTKNPDIEIVFDST